MTPQERKHLSQQYRQGNLNTKVIGAFSPLFQQLPKATQIALQISYPRMPHADFTFTGNRPYRNQWFEHNGVIVLLNQERMGNAPHPERMSPIRIEVLQSHTHPWNSLSEKEQIQYYQHLAGFLLHQLHAQINENSNLAYQHNNICAQIRGMASSPLAWIEAQPDYVAHVQHLLNMRTTPFKVKC